MRRDKIVNAGDSDWCAGGSWSSSGEETGAWVRANFGGMYTVQRFMFEPSDGYFRGIELTFRGSSETQAYELENNHDAQTFVLTQPIVTDQITITFTSVWSQVNIFCFRA